MQSQRGLKSSTSTTLPFDAPRSSSAMLPSSNTTTPLAIPLHFTHRGDVRPSSRQSSTKSVHQMTGSFFRRILAKPFKSRSSSHHGRSISVQTSVVSFTTVDTSSFDDDLTRPECYESSSPTDVDSDCEMVEYLSDDGSPITLRGSSPLPDAKICASSSTPAFSNPFNSSEPILAPIAPIIPPPQPKKKAPRRNPHRVQHLSEFIATRRASALMCPPSSPGFSTTMTARRRSSCKSSLAGGLPSPHSPYQKWHYATEDSRHDVSPRRTSYVGETSNMASLPIPPWRRFRRVPPSLGDVESQRESVGKSPATSSVPFF